VADIGGVIAAVATIGLLITAIVAGSLAKEQLVGLRSQLTLQQQMQRQRRVYDHIERLFDRDFVLMLSTAEEWTKAEPFVLWLRGSDPPPRPFEEWQRMHDSPDDSPLASASAKP
jgi:hypothetical protein